MRRFKTQEIEQIRAIVQEEIAKAAKKKAPKQAAPKKDAKAKK